MRALMFVAVFTMLTTPAIAADKVPATGGDIEITPLIHSSVQIEHAGKVIQVDPWSMGDLSRAVMDEQMSEGMLAHAGKKSLADPARKIAYGFMERPVHQEAKRAGVAPGAFQDVAWAGFKNERGKPMIEHINDAIERTHRLTGRPRDEIVRRGLSRGEIPIYSRTGVVAIPGLQNEQQ